MDNLVVSCFSRNVNDCKTLLKWSGVTRRSSIRITAAAFHLNTDLGSISRRPCSFANLRPAKAFIAKQVPFLHSDKHTYLHAEHKFILRSTQAE